jgi:ABC-2 type transport system ATP-binding protein
LEVLRGVDLEVGRGRKNLVLMARLRHVRDPGAVADELLARFDLTEASPRRVATYSGGMRRRLDIAMSLIGTRRSSSSTSRRPGSIRRTHRGVAGGQGARRRWDDGAAHDPVFDEAEQLADRIAILHEGRIIVNSTLAELKQSLPPASVEYAEKQPTLQDVFLALVGEEAQR